jgi:hypothetical protein
LISMKANILYTFSHWIQTTAILWIECYLQKIRTYSFSTTHTPEKL